MKESVKAYAKINLHLDVCAKRADGYHDVELVMQSVSLHDVICAELTESGDVICVCDNAYVPTNEKNIAYRAARLFLEYTGDGRGARISIEKHIPMAAGLAGGSTDAAATLIALNKLMGHPLDLAALCTLGARLGADVPFCICGGTAFTDGRGDVIHSFPSIPQNSVIVIACGGEGVSTPWAYNMLDEMYNDFKDYARKGTDALRSVLLSENPEDFYKYTFNLFEDGVFAERPVAAALKGLMLANGAKGAMMSGSGPSVFGVFSSKTQAELAVNEIKESLPECFVEICTPVEQNEI